MLYNQFHLSTHCLAKLKMASAHQPRSIYELWLTGWRLRLCSFCNSRKHICTSHES